MIENSLPTTLENVSNLSDNQRTRHHARRLNRQKNRSHALMLSLPAPFGPHIVNEYQGIHVMIETNKGTIPWADIPSSCDPMRFMGIKQDERRMPHLSDLMNHLGLPFHVNVKTQPGPSESDATQTKADDMAVHDANVIRRAQQKRDQIESFYHILKKMLTSEEVRSRHGSEIRTRVVDFGAGTGALALPLAFLFPFSDFVAVEMKETSLAILNKRKNEAGLSNLTIFHGMIESFDTPFDVSVSLHGCGCASDQAIKLSRHHRAAFIVSSCCIGKIGFTATGGSSFSPSPGDYEFSPKVGFRVSRTSTSFSSSSSSLEGLWRFKGGGGKGRGAP